MTFEEFNFARKRLHPIVLKEILKETRLPDYMHEGLILYLVEGILPGDFLTAVLQNDFMEACGRADATNRDLLFDYALFLYNDAPRWAWGSVEKVRQWTEHGTEARRLVFEAEAPTGEGRY